MKQAKRLWKFAKDITATEYSDSDGEGEPRFVNLREHTHLATENRHGTPELKSPSVLELPTLFVPRTPTYSQPDTPDRVPHSSAQSTRECVVCLDQRASTDFAECFSQHCNHTQRQICTDCVREHIRTAITDHSNTNVRCPEQNCTSHFDFDTIQRVLVDINLQGTRYRTDLSQFENCLSEKYIETLSNWTWCAHGCGGGSQVVDGDILTCTHCGRKTCVHHRTRWHTGMTCEQYDLSLKVRKNDRATDKWLQNNTKQCPKCKAKIEKHGGCDHMTCGYCRYEFCWECSADYNRIRQHGNQSHAIHCKYYV